MKPTNLLFLFSDEYQRASLGCYGNSVVQTPHLDRLAERGTTFTNAYTNCPICVPCRASMATGRYVHQIGNWDNAFPYTGTIPTWHHRLRDQGHRVDSIGKLHFRRQEDDNGFSQSHDAMYVAEGIGELISCIRENPPLRKGRNGILKAGPGESSYLRYDARTGANGSHWLKQHAKDEKPWALFLSFVCPHPPFIAPPAFYERYRHEDMPLPNQWRLEEWPQHPALNFLRRYFGWEEPFEEADVRRAIATYYAMCSYVDHQIGTVLETLATLGLEENTRIIYSTDHGAMMGGRGLWGKFAMYEESAALPLILAGPDVPVGKTVQTPVSLVDCHPTVIEAVGATPVDEDADLPGASLWQIAQEPDRSRTIFSEYHAAGTRNGMYMLSDGGTKYVHFVHESPQLFDLANDPQELVDLADSPAHQPLRAEMERRLREIVDPVAVDAQAKADQQAKLEEYGGEEAVLKRGLSNSAIPGEAPIFHQVTRP